MLLKLLRILQKKNLSSREVEELTRKKDKNKSIKVFDTELLIKTKLTNLSDILIKKLLVDLCNLGNSNL